MFSGVSTGAKLELRGLPTSLVVVIPSRCEGSRFLAKLEMTPEEVGTELASSDSDGTAAVCCGICDDTAGNQNGNCHLAQLG